jgi:Holliday junction resolvase RusA-like endonuclease
MIRFTVLGQPATKGSARAFIVPGGARGPRAIITNDAGQKAKSWAAVVSDAARAAAGDAKLLEGPVRVSMLFHLQRPRAHFRSSGALKESAPSHVATRPDIDKFLRCGLDALTGVLFVDDGQIAILSSEKLYTNDGRTGATIEVEAIAPLVATVVRRPTPQVSLPLPAAK